MTDLDREVCPRKFWVHTARPLPEIGDTLIRSGVVEAARHDCENVYEWLECELAGCAVELNVSRKHHDGDVNETEPLAFLLIGSDLPAMTAMVDQIAARVESALQQPVMIGAIEYLGGDDFRYVPDRE
jgi:hypothetical protein